MVNQIELNASGECAKWEENFDSKEIKIPLNQYYNSCQQLIVSPSFRSILFPFHTHIFVVDLLKGHQTQLKFDGFKKFEHNHFKFFPLNDIECFVFRMDFNGGAVKIYGSKFKLDFENKEMKQMDSEWQKLIDVYSLDEISSFVVGESVLFNGIVQSFNIVPRNFLNQSHFISEFNLKTREFVPNSKVYYTDSIYIQASRPQFSYYSHKFNNTFYTFHGFSLPGLRCFRNFFSKITKIERNVEEAKLLKLNGFEECCKFEESAECFDKNGQLITDWHLTHLNLMTHGKWLHNNFYLHFQLDQLYLPNEFKHQFFQLNIDTLQWVSIIMPKFQLTEMPLKWSINEDHVLLLVTSRNAMVAHGNVDEEGCVLLETKEEWKKEKGSAFRMPLRRPDSLLKLSISSINQHYPKWHQNTNAIYCF